MTPDQRGALRAYHAALGEIVDKDLSQRGTRKDALQKVRDKYEPGLKIAGLEAEMRKLGLWHRNRLLRIEQPADLAADLDAMFQEPEA